MIQWCLVTLYDKILSNFNKWISIDKRDLYFVEFQKEMAETGPLVFTVRCFWLIHFTMNTRPLDQLKLITIIIQRWTFGSLKKNLRRLCKKYMDCGWSLMFQDYIGFALVKCILPHQVVYHFIIFFSTRSGNTKRVDLLFLSCGHNTVLSS